MAKKIAMVVDRTDELVGYVFWCPGCDSAHQIDFRWIFNNDVDCPTFTPSYKATRGLKERTQLICHLYVKLGKIEFLKDCTHALAGQTVDMPDWTKDDPY